MNKLKVFYKCALPKMFRVLKELTSKWAPGIDAINDENLVTVTKDEDIKQMEGVQNQTILPLRSEVEQALQQIQNGKLPGAGDIPAEFWKALGENGIDLV